MSWRFPTIAENLLVFVQTLPHILRTPSRFVHNDRPKSVQNAGFLQDHSLNDMHFQER